ncbi:hypothetical protein TNCV_2869271 [Trichonephila clavipes]|nr:hypothetical protein TNCV_2869271 [Trichonephila clavipes]
MSLSSSATEDQPCREVDARYISCSSKSSRSCQTDHLTETSAHAPRLLRSRVVVYHVISDVPRCVRHDAEYFVLDYLNLFHVGGGCGSPYGRSLDTLRENRGIIRKQASTDGGVLWEVVRVYVVQVR